MRLLSLMLISPVSRLCSDVHRKTTLLISVVPVPPTGLNIINEYHTNMKTAVTLDWNPAQGSGPEAIVDNYTISISPDPPYYSSPILAHSPPRNVTLDHNVVYTIDLVAINCAGESEQFNLSNIQYGRL